MAANHRRFVGAIAAGAFWACAPQPPTTKVAPSPQLIEALESADPVDVVRPEPAAYSPEGKRDPFAGRETMTPFPHPDLGQLRLAFTNTGSSTPMAVVIDSENRSHNVHVGDFLGKHWGRVSAIRRDEITITELYAGNDRRPFSQDVVLRMPKDSAPTPTLSEDSQ